MSSLSEPGRKSECSRSSHSGCSGELASKAIWIILILARGDSEDSILCLADSIASTVAGPSALATNLAFMSREVIRGSFGPRRSSRESRDIAASSKSPVSSDIECFSRSIAREAISLSSFDRLVSSTKFTSESIDAVSYTHLTLPTICCV